MPVASTWPEATLQAIRRQPQPVTRRQLVERELERIMSDVRSRALDPGKRLSAALSSLQASGRIRSDGAGYRSVARPRRPAREPDERLSWPDATRQAIERLVARSGERRFALRRLRDQELDAIRAAVGGNSVRPDKQMSKAVQTLKDIGRLRALGRGEYEYVAPAKQQ